MGLVFRLLPFLVGAAGLAVIVFAIHHHGYRAGVDSERAVAQTQLVQRMDAERAAVAARLRENALLQQAFDNVNLEDAKRHEQADAAVQTERDRLRADVRRAGGLRIAASCPATGGAAAAAEARADGGPVAPAARTVALPEQVEGDLLNLVAEADAVVEQARAMQRRLLADAREAATVP